MHTKFLTIAVASMTVAQAADAAIIKQKLSDIIPGTEVVSLVSNGDFEDLSSGNNFLPAGGWGRFGNQFYSDPAPVPNTGSSVARTHADGGGQNGYTLGLNLLPNTEYVMSAYIAHLGDANHGGRAEFDLGDAFGEPDDSVMGGGSISISQNEADANLGYYVSGTFNTSFTGTTPTLRIFHVIPGGTNNSNWPNQPVSAIWDNIAVTPVSSYVAPTLLDIDLSIDASLERAVFQRTTQNDATVPLTGSVGAGVSAIEARAIPRAGSPGTATDWQVIATNPAAGNYASELTLEGGWYDVEVRSLDGTTVVEQRSVERVGVGEVFVIAGQSNSANWGSPRLSAQDDRVSSFDLNSWRHADDPQPIADNSGGSPWPALGDAIAADQDVPVGFISVGVGGTQVAQWLPGGSLYPRLQSALQALGPDGARAVLWHQGEADNEANTSTANYAQRLETIIDQSRIDAGFDIPWGIAQASYLSYLFGNETDANIITAQAQVAANDPLNFVGAMTDDLINPVLGDNTWRHDDIHFNEAGLREHADRWFEQLMVTFDFVQFIGDFDSDDDVDAGDLGAWITGFGMTGGGTLADGDADGDQDVDGSDFLAWQRNFGKGLSTSIATSSYHVPEPTGMALVLIGLGVAGMHLRKR